MTRLATAVLLGTLVFAACPKPEEAQPAPATGTLQGQVIDPEGAAIARAFVLVHGGPKGINQQLQLNDWGKFEVQVPPGTYDIFVGATGFVPFAKALRVQPDKPFVLKVKLKVDLEHLED